MHRNLKVIAISTLICMLLLLCRNTGGCILRGETNGICINKTLLGDNIEFCSGYIHDTICVPLFSV